MNQSQLEQLKNNIEYCKYVASNAGSKYMREQFAQIADDLDSYMNIIKGGTYFFLDEKEAAAADKFYEEHVKGRYFGASGGGMTYHFTPNGLGIGVSVSTVKNGERISENITNYENW